MPSLRLPALLAALALFAAPLPAQQRTVTSDLRVTLVAGPSPTRGGRTEVVRRAHRSPQNLVIVSRNATAEDLAAALVTLSALRAQFGDSLTTDLRARPDKSRPGPQFDQSAYHTWLVQQLVRLRSAREADLADLGRVKAVDITLPSRPVSRSAGPR